MFETYHKRVGITMSRGRQFYKNGIRYEFQYFDCGIYHTDTRVERSLVRIAVYGQRLSFFEI